MRTWARLAVLGFCCVTPAALAESVYSFENVTAGQALPFSLSVNGLTATFGGQASVCGTAGLSGNLFLSLTGNALMQGFCQPNGSGPVSITFSSDLTKLSFALAINGGATAPVTVTYLQNGNVVGTQTIQPAIPDGALSPEAAVSYSGVFNAVTVSSTALLAIDNVDAVPVGLPPR